MHLLRCILQGFGISLAIFGGFSGLAYLTSRLGDWLHSKIGDWAIVVVLGLFLFVGFGTVFTLACLGILH